MAGIDWRPVTHTNWSDILANRNAGCRVSPYISKEPLQVRERLAYKVEGAKLQVILRRSSDPRLMGAINGTAETGRASVGAAAIPTDSGE